MPKPVAVNPKLSFTRKVLAKVRPILLRGMGQLARVQVNPAAAVQEADKLEAELTTHLTQLLGASGHSVMPWSDAAAGATGWFFGALTGRRNLMHGGQVGGCVVGFVENGTVTVAGVLLGHHEDAAIAALGEGANVGERCRASGRTGLLDALVMLPMSSADGAQLKLLELGETHTFHTRKSGCAIADALAVATGRADAMVATRLLPLEAATIALFAREAGAIVSNLQGVRGTAASGTSSLLAASAKVHPELLKLLA